MCINQDYLQFFNENLKFIFWLFLSYLFWPGQDFFSSGRAFSSLWQNQKLNFIVENGFLPSFSSLELVAEVLSVLEAFYDIKWKIYHQICTKGYKAEIDVWKRPPKMGNNLWFDKFDKFWVSVIENQLVLKRESNYSCRNIASFGSK